MNFKKLQEKADSKKEYYDAIISLGKGSRKDYSDQLIVMDILCSKLLSKRRLIRVLKEELTASCLDELLLKDFIERKPSKRGRKKYRRVVLHRREMRDLVEYLQAEERTHDNS